MENNIPEEKIDCNYITDYLECLLKDEFVGECKKSENELTLLLLGGKEFTIKISG